MSEEWWKGAVFYQIYPRSFKDSNGDGIGDLVGATQKLDHIASTGFDAIWLSPFYPSPMKDFGYDISHYCDVDPIFGTLDDFDFFLEKAHRLGLKVIIDMVLAHTSDQHAWFQESKASPDNKKSDWYIWHDPKPDGSPPNNWQSIFGGPAWHFETRRGQYYMHHFLTSQPQLNYRNPDVQKAILNTCKFWLDRGIDGLRLDVINYIYVDEKLRDNPAKECPTPSSQYDGLDPYNMQQHLYDKSQPEAINFAKKFREMINQYPGTMTLAEIGDDDFVRCAADYTSGNDKYHTAYNFSLMTGKNITADRIKSAIEDYHQYEGGWPSWSFCNHDVVRVVSRWGKENGYEDSRDFAKILIALLCSLKGTIFMYQGEELGLTEADIPFEKLQDPWGKYLWPEWQGRDGCRTPMLWSEEEKHAGFSNAEISWLPIPVSHDNLSVKAQQKNPDSVLNFTKNFLEWRKTNPDLVSGDIEFFETDNAQILCFKRGESLLCVFNLSNQKQIFNHAFQVSESNLSFVDNTQIETNKITLSPFGIFYGLIE